MFFGDVKIFINVEAADSRDNSILYNKGWKGSKLPKRYNIKYAQPHLYIFFRV